MPIATKFLAALAALLITLALVAGGVLTTQMAYAGAEIVSDIPPPALRAEREPPPRDGYVWSAGHWEWSGHAYSWVSGTWIVAHPKAHWVVDRWDQEGEHWHYVPGHWER